MPNKKVELILEMDVCYKLKFVNYERINGRRLKGSVFPRNLLAICSSASITVQIVKKRGTRTIMEFSVLFNRDKKKWRVPGRDNSLVVQDIQARAVATLNKRFPNGVVRSTDSVAA